MRGRGWQWESSSPAGWQRGKAALHQGPRLSPPGSHTEQSMTWSCRGDPFLGAWLRAALDLPIRGN